MPSLPITVPHGYTLTVKVGDAVSMNDILANPPKDIPIDTSAVSLDEYVIDLTEIYATRSGNVGRLLKKSLGENVSIGDVIAERTSGLGLKKEQVLASVPGTVLRFERDTGRLIVKKSQSSLSPDPSHEAMEPLLSPLDGKITVCNNEQIVIEGKTSSLVGIKGVGGKASGKLVILTTKDGDPVESKFVTGDMIGKILLVPYMTRDALVKASAIGVAGVIGISIVQEDLDYLTEKKLDLPVMDIDKEVAKKLKEKEGKQIFIEGSEKILLLS